MAKNKPHLHAIHSDSIGVAALWADVIIILFIAAIPYLTIGATTFAYMRERIFIPLFIYLIIETFETAHRRSNDMKGFIGDNGLALLGLIGCVVEFWTWRKTLGYDQWLLMLYSISALAFNAGFGLILALRIAFSGKEREEDLAER